MDQLVIAIISGVANGAIYGLMGLGLVIIFRSTDVVNFALASMATVAIYVGLTAVNAGVPVLLALVVAVAFGALMGVVVREVTIRPLGEGRLFAALVVTMGLSLIAEAAISKIWGESARSFPRLIGGTVPIGGQLLYTQSLLAVVLAAVAMLAIGVLFTRTPLGSAMRAVAESSETAAILGVNSQKVARIAWGLGLALAVLAAFLYAPSTGLAPTILATLLFRSFAGIFLGGLASMYGAVVGGLLIGVMDNLAATYVSASFRDTFVFSAAVLVLLVRPHGLFGRAAFQRV